MSINQMGLLYVFNVVAFTPAFYPSANPLLGPVVGLLLVLPIVGIYILFSIGIPRTGGDYVWVSRVFNPGIGFHTNFAFTFIVLSVVGSVAPWIGQWSIGPMFYDLGQTLQQCQLHQYSQCPPDSEQRVHRIRGFHRNRRANCDRQF